MVYLRLEKGKPGKSPGNKVIVTCLGRESRQYWQNVVWSGAVAVVATAWCGVKREEGYQPCGIEMEGGALTQRGVQGQGH